MHVLVTGGAGFIGSHTVLELLNSGFTLTVIDNFVNSIPDAEGNAVSLKRVETLVGKEIPFKKVDVLNIPELEKVFKAEKFDAVIHLAALKAVGESSEKPLDYYTNNLIGSLNLISLCKKYNVKNFVFSSSATVYGKPSKLPIREDAQTGVVTESALDLRVKKTQSSSNTVTNSPSKSTATISKSSRHSDDDTLRKLTSLVGKAGTSMNASMAAVVKSPTNETKDDSDPCKIFTCLQCFERFPGMQELVEHMSKTKHFNQAKPLTNNGFLDPHSLLRQSLISSQKN